MATYLDTDFEEGDLIEAAHVKQFAAPVNALESGAAFFREDESVAANVYKVTFDDPEANGLVALTDGLMIHFKAGSENTDAVNLVVDGVSGTLGTHAITKHGGDALEPGDIKQGQMVAVLCNVVDGMTTRFEMIGVSSSGMAGETSLSDLTAGTLGSSTPLVLASSQTGASASTNYLAGNGSGVTYNVETSGTHKFCVAGNEAFRINSSGIVGADVSGKHLVIETTRADQRLEISAKNGQYGGLRIKSGGDIVAAFGTIPGSYGGSKLWSIGYQGNESAFVASDYQERSVIINSGVASAYTYIALKQNGVEMARFGSNGSYGGPNIFNVGAVNNANTYVASNYTATELTLNGGGSSGALIGKVNGAEVHRSVSGGFQLTNTKSYLIRNGAGSSSIRVATVNENDVVMLGPSSAQITGLSNESSRTLFPSSTRGLFFVYSDTSGEFGLFFLDGTSGSMKISGSTNYVAGSPAASEVGLEIQSGNYQLNNRSGGTRSLYVTKVA